jgi:hypothetical protein
MAAAAAWITIIWIVSLPIALVFARRQGFLAGDDPVVILRVPIVAFVAPALVLVAAVAGGFAIAKPSRPADK